MKCTQLGRWFSKLNSTATAALWLMHFQHTKCRKFNLFNEFENTKYQQNFNISNNEYHHLRNTLDSITWIWQLGVVMWEFSSLQKRCRRHKKHTWCDTNLLGMKTFPKKKPLSLSVNISRVLLILGDKIMNKSEGIFLCKLKGNKTFSKILQCKWGKRRALTQFSAFLPKRIERIKNR